MEDKSNMLMPWWASINSHLGPVLGEVGNAVEKFGPNLSIFSLCDTAFLRVCGIL